MRLFGSLATHARARLRATGGAGALLGATAVAGLLLAATPTAQDPFKDVPVEPRPSEHIHWDASAFERFKTELTGKLGAGEGIWGTPFVVLNALPRADHRPHDVQIIHRAGYTQPEIHTNKWDIYVILDGSGTARIGGKRVNYVDGQPHASQKPQLEGAQEFRVTKGDIVHVPARTWHQVVVEPGSSITYALINVIE
jgi:mannose-6-phosphate isomerase-like protein (cupin superfamily)